MKQSIEIIRFAERVERLCDFLLDRLGEEKQRDDSNDLKVIFDLKEEAANLQMVGGTPATETLGGLYDYMQGVPPVPEQE
jgi:hypothetical protein